MPQERNKWRPKGLTGLAKHGTTVSLAPARAITSHARRLYHQRYVGRYRSAHLVFAFDALLVGIVAILAIFDITILLQSYRSAPPGLGLDFKAPTLVAADETPLEIDISSTDGKTHDGVKLKWHLPEWIDVIQAAPHMGPDGSVDIGTVKPGETKTSRVLARIHANPGTKVQFGFGVSQNDSPFLALEYPASETRLVERSALTAAPVFGADNFMPGSVFPLMVSNEGRSTDSAVAVHLLNHQGAPEAGFGSADTFVIGDMAPGEKRLAILDLGNSLEPDFTLGWEVRDGAHAVEGQTMTLQSATSERVEIVKTDFDAAGKLDIGYSTPVAASIWVSCGATSSRADPWHSFDIAAGSGSVSYAPTSGSTGADCSIVPLDYSSDSVGVPVKATKGNTLPFMAAVRYYSDTGDQLGVGPLPPRVGEATTYWVIWNVGPFDSDLKDVKIQTILPDEVKATGKFASALAGNFSTDGKNVTWSVPSLALAGNQKATFAFEIGFSPMEKDAGNISKLLGQSFITAVTSNGNHEISSESSGDDTNLKSDAKAKDRGAVQGK